MRLTHIILGILTMVFVSVAFMTVATDIGNNYNATYGKDFDDIQDNMSYFNTQISSLVGEDIAPKAPGGADASAVEDSGDYEGGIVRSGWKAITEVPAIFTVFKNIITLLSEKLLIPAKYYAAAFIAMVLVVSFILISTIMRNRL